MSGLDHLELLAYALSFAAKVVALHVFLADLNLHLANLLLLVLQLIFQIDPLRLKLLDFLTQVEFDYAEIFDLHLLGLQFAHLMEDFVLFRRLLSFCSADACHQGIVLLAQLTLILLLHTHLVLQ